MAVNTSFNTPTTRNMIIKHALLACHAWPEDDNPSVERIKQVVERLNSIFAEESQWGVGANVHLWALKTRALFLTADKFVFDTTGDLPDDIMSIEALYARSSSGDDSPVDLISRQGYAGFFTKNEPGDVSHVWFEEATDPANNKLHVWPAPSSVTSPDEVTSSSVNYKCLLAHTSAAVNEPGVGSDWTNFWQVGGSSGSAWVTATEYTTGEALILVYARPLFLFVSPYDNPDMPLGWDNYLINRLALALSGYFNLDMAERQWLEREAAKARHMLFPNSRKKLTNFHNKAQYF